MTHQFAASSFHLAVLHVFLVFGDVLVVPDDTENVSLDFIRGSENITQLRG
jgi:hypothetical protein